MSIFEFDCYKKYLVYKIGSYPANGRGVKKKLAAFLGCQPTYISHVIKGRSDLSLEQTVKVNDFLKHTDDEGHFFVLLVEYSRANSDALKRHFKDQILKYIKWLDKVDPVAKMLNLFEFGNSDEVLKKYRSEWYYGAIHMLTSSTEFNTVKSIANYLRLSDAKVESVLNFLVEASLVSNESGSYSIKSYNIIHGGYETGVGNDAVGWRNRAINSIDSEGGSSIYHTSLFAINHRETETIKNEIVEFVSDLSKKYKVNANSEEVRALNVDFFKI